LIGEHERALALDRRRRGMYILPSVFTAGNIAAGFYAITQCFAGASGDSRHFDYAALAIGFAIPFDALDGRIARMTNTTSQFGKELDSLADVITFGVAPSLLAFTWGFALLPTTLPHLLRRNLVELGAFVCFVFLLCGATRLARFNSTAIAIPKNPGQPGRKYFVGMPIPAAAGAVAAVVHLFEGAPISVHWGAALWMIFVGLIGFLMVSTWRFWSGKEINLSRRHGFRWILLFGIFIWALVFFSQYVLVSLALVYTFSGILARLAYGWQRKAARA
jgi:CDP-diacylglycerol---serine O-phosphatidyltransferase